MNCRSHSLPWSLAVALVIAGCSSGLGNNLPRRGGNQAATNPNLALGVDLGLIPTQPVVAGALAGVVVPAIGNQPARELALLVFTSAADAQDADGAGKPLSRDAVTDGNGAEDVFAAVISARDTERRAFSQSLAGKFRHPRCSTCHSMQAADTLAFVSSPLQHAGPLPGLGFPSNDPGSCQTCHVTSNTFPVPGWQAPAASFDFRGRTVAQLADAAARVPIDEPEHFVKDKRVLWALDSGILPQVGGRNGAADDDHDGIFEPEDIDGIPRPVPGGSALFLSQFEQWNESGRVLTPAGAVRDVTLVSRAAGANAAGNGASSLPTACWVPNPLFDPSSAGSAAASNPIGTLFIAYQSTASNLVAGDTNGAMDVFRTAVELRAEEDVDGSPLAGGLNLRVLDTTILVSTRDGANQPGNAASGRPVIGGSEGQWIAFESLATDLVAGFVDANGPAAPDVYLRLTTILQTRLVSHVPGNPVAAGNGGSFAPAIDPTGVAVAFESDATDLLPGDTNGVRDVFFAATDAGPPFQHNRASVGDAGQQGAGGASGGASIHVGAAGRTLVAFESDKIDLAPGLIAATNVYLFDSSRGASTLLNQRISPTGNAVGDGPARHAVIGQDGAAVAFQSVARNIDVLRAVDENYASDVFLVETAQLGAGNVLPYRFSLTTAEAAPGDNASTRPLFSTLPGSTSFKVGVAAYSTIATNLGATDSSDIIVAFLDETSGVLPDFDAAPLVGPAPLQVQFTDRSAGLPTGWQWDLDGDGNDDSTLQNPVFVYTAPGLYSVRLRARNANSEAEVIRSDLVRALGPVTADFSVSTTSGSLPLTVIFTDLSSEAFGSISAWEWDFDNDGIIDSTLQNPSFSYPTEGVYSVSLRVTGLGGAATVTKPNLIDVGPPGPVTAEFTSVRAGYNNEAIQFTDLSIGVVTSWLWDFGDGFGSTLQNPTHTFATPGTYTVTLTVSGPGGSDDETKPGWFTSVPASVTIDLESGRDTSIYSEAPNNSNGANGELVCGNAATLAGVQFGIRRALLWFDVESAVPAGSTVLGASLRLTCTFNPVNPTGPQSVALRRVTRAWVQGTTNGGIGGGAAAQGNDATWANARSGAGPIPWTNAGGDFVAGITQSQTVNTAGVYTWNSNATMISNVQGWLDAPADNHGWILRAPEVSGQRSAKVFGSRENGTAASRPRLSITYRPPLPVL